MRGTIFGRSLRPWVSSGSADDGPLEIGLPVADCKRRAPGEAKAVRQLISSAHDSTKSMKSTRALRSSVRSWSAGLGGAEWPKCPR